MSHITSVRGKSPNRDNLTWCKTVRMSVFIAYGVCCYPINDEDCKGCKLKGELIK